MQRTNVMTQVPVVLLCPSSAQSTQVRRVAGLVILAAMWGCSATALFSEDRFDVSSAVRDKDGFLVHRCESDFQSQATQIRVLLPEVMGADKKLRVVFVLPVEAQRENRYGDGLLEVQRLGLHNKHNTVFVAPTFSELPWYGDHPTNRSLRQESYFLKVVVPSIEKSYPVSAVREGRFLLGFSKSGWGAWTLLLRNSELFARAAAWDAPMMMERPGQFGSGIVFPTEADFAGYRVSTLMRKQRTDDLSIPRFILTGYDNFRNHHEEIHALMQEMQIPHVYRDGPKRKHDWHSGWVAESVELLLAK